MNAKRINLSDKMNKTRQIFGDAENPRCRVKTADGIGYPAERKYSLYELFTRDKDEGVIRVRIVVLSSSTHLLFIY